MTVHESVGDSYDVKSFPTQKFFGDDKSKPIDYVRSRDTDSIRNFCLDQTISEVNGRIKYQNKEKSAVSSSKGSDNNGRSDKDVVTLTEANFDELALRSKDIWFVEFYAPWCGHCKALEPVWNEVATKMKGKVNFGKVDSTVDIGLADRFKVTSYPTIYYWDYGDDKSSSSHRMEYVGLR
jgi:protein disulfide-isomerase A6